MNQTDSQNRQPKTVFETVELSPSEIASVNAQYAAMGLDAIVIDVSRFIAKSERQEDGTWKRSLIRRKAKSNETGTDRKKPEGK